MADAIGASFEGLPTTDLLRAYLEGRYRVDSLSLALWTDDTALTLATAQSMLERGGVDGADMAAKYLAWYEGGARGIGRSTRESMQRLQAGTPWAEAGQTGEYAAGNGVAMRTAPIGLWHSRDLDGVEGDVRTSGVITHRNEEALIGGEMAAVAVARAAAPGFDPEMTMIELAGRTPPSRCLDRLEQALDLYRGEAGTVNALETLGLGGAAFETVPSALYCVLAAEGDVEETLCLSVLAGGDADTRGAIAGAVVGAWRGAGAIPDRWIRQLAGADTIAGVAEDLAELVTSRTTDRRR